MKLHTLLAVVFAGSLLLNAPTVMAQEEESANQVVRVVGGFADGIVNLIYDVVDAVDVNLAWSAPSEPGFALDAGITDLARLGTTQVTATRVGLENPRDTLLWEDESYHSGISILGIQGGDVAHDAYDAGASVHLGWIGLEAGTNVRSILDAITQVVFIDLEGDNVNRF